MIPLYENIRKRRIELGMSQQDLADKLGYKSRSAINKIELGINDLTQSKIIAFAKALDTTPGELMGLGEQPNLSPTSFNTFYAKYPAPEITEDYVTFPVIGEIAAGYDNIAMESWDGDTVKIPAEFLKGRERNEFFVLSVKGDSMYPAFQEGDKVLILKQSTLNHSGQIGAVLYDDECATLKKIEYVMGEDWMKLIPINPSYPPKTIRDEDLERCKVIGIPKLLIREIEE